ncbi:CDP-glycerol glycerophosphotransferase family protein [Carboxylicivirga caseinilyticus]|uniref:CDP-glycerol glycerophosphotransferase family protein n=1 Tax=Carboxylicivirga caseinilyticus TaxID=3417572 RepID=UPI003D3255E5|nr:CDP-glycerol glycerophosphotransferase family protein [Marinilabiliaceae bacterium A049]
MSKFLYYLFGNVLFVISSLFPKSLRIWVFGSWGGKAYADNPKYLFEYTTLHHHEIKCIWLTRDKDVRTHLRKEGYNAYYINSLLGVFYCMRASVGVISHGLVDLNRYSCARMKIVETWHGIPLKPVLLSDQKEEAKIKYKRSLQLRYVFPFLWKSIRYRSFLAIPSTSDYTTEILKKVFGKTAPIVKIGLPRLDAMLKPNMENEIAILIKNIRANGNNVGIYMPTYRREYEFDIVSELVKNINVIEKQSRNKGFVLFIKIHPFDFKKLPTNFKSNNVIFLLDSEINNDIYQILGLFDFLITDYSSIIFDFLILSKPIYLLTPDRDAYIESNGEFVFDYRELNLPVFNDWNSILEFYSNWIDDKTEDDLKRISKQVHSYFDSKSSKRMVDLIMSKIMC